MNKEKAQEIVDAPTQRMFNILYLAIKELGGKFECNLTETRNLHKNQHSLITMKDDIVNNTTTLEI